VKLTEKQLLGIVDLTLKLGRVNRATLHPDGERWESDTDHTVMLGLVACTIAEELYPTLDLGFIMCLSTVHDLAEAHCGDTNTLGISADDRAAKAEREVAAVQQIESDLGRMSFVASMLRVYESQKTPEARFVRLVDKLLPKYTHLLNGGAGFRKMGKSPEDIEAAHAEQLAALEAKYNDEFPEMISIIAIAMGQAVFTYRTGVRI
jgi:putative hydrolase of HD superfamily